MIDSENYIKTSLIIDWRCGKTRYEKSVDEIKKLLHSFLEIVERAFFILTVSSAGNENISSKESKMHCPIHINIETVCITM